MESRVQLWGNRLAVPVPEPLAAELGLGHDSAVEVTIRDGALTVRPLGTTGRDLETLFSRMGELGLVDPTEWHEHLGRETW